MGSSPKAKRDTRAAAVLKWPQRCAMTSGRRQSEGDTEDGGDGDGGGGGGDEGGDDQWRW